MYLSFKYKISLFIFAYANRTPLARVHSSQFQPKLVFCLQFSMITDIIRCKISDNILKEIQDFQNMNVKKLVHCVPCVNYTTGIGIGIYHPRYTESEIPFLLSDLNLFSFFLPVLSTCFCFYIFFLIRVSAHFYLKNSVVQTN